MRFERATKAPEIRTKKMAIKKPLHLRHYTIGQIIRLLV